MIQRFARPHTRRPGPELVMVENSRMGCSRIGKKASGANAVRPLPVMVFGPPDLITVLPEIIQMQPR